VDHVNILVSIIEDDATARRILVGWINRAKGFRCVSEHGSGEEALAQLPAASPDIVLVDINLPGMSGIECVRQLKLQRPGAQFVILTVYEDTEHIFAALAAGASGYLLKRTTRERLLAALTDVQEGGSPMTSNIARKVVQSFQPPRTEGSGPLDLSHREREVLELLARGYAFKEIAEILSISVTTVSTYVRRVYEKLHVRSRAQAVATYAQFARGGEAWRRESTR